MVLASAVEYEISNCNWLRVWGKFLLSELPRKGSRMRMLSSLSWRWLKSLSSIQMLSPVVWCIHLSRQRGCALVCAGNKKKTINELQSLQQGNCKLPCRIKHVYGNWTYRYYWSTKFPSLLFQKKCGFYSQHRPVSHWEKLGSHFMLTASFLPCLPDYANVFTMCSVKFSLWNTEKLVSF